MLSIHFPTGCSCQELRFTEIKTLLESESYNIENFGYCTKLEYFKAVSKLSVSKIEFDEN